MRERRGVGLKRKKERADFGSPGFFSKKQRRQKKESRTGEKLGEKGQNRGIKTKKKEGTKRDRTQGNFWSLNQQQILVLLPPFVFVLNGEDWAETQTKKKNWGNWTEKEKKKRELNPDEKPETGEKNRGKKKPRTSKKKPETEEEQEDNAGAYKGTEAELWLVIHHVSVS
jgi:hypothetical protein